MSVLLQISDTHFGTEQPQVVEALVALARQQRPDVVVLSGDITQRARPAQFRAAKAFVEKRPPTLLGISSVPSPSSVQSARSEPFCGSVMATTWFFSASLPSAKVETLVPAGLAISRILALIAAMFAPGPAASMARASVTTMSQVMAA